jgi:hypothetical protein
VRFGSARRFAGRSRLTFVVAFQGNDRLTARRAPRAFVAAR